MINLVTIPLDFTIILVLVYRICVWNGNLNDILIRDTHGPVSTLRIQGMSSARILRNDGTVVVLLGEKNVPESFDRLLRTVIVSGKMFNNEGCQITRRKSEGGSKFDLMI